jgi:hypothetical protein
VERWGANPSCLILSILVASSDFVNENAANSICMKYREEDYRKRRYLEQYPSTPNFTSSSKAELLLQNLPNINYAFCVIDWEMTRTLFGDTFTKLIDMTKKRPVKRPAPEDEKKPDTMSRSAIKQRKLTHENPMQCSACGEEGHMKNNRKCREYKTQQR